MNTNQLRYFVTAAECRSFTKAADQFYITQTAITQQIHALEDSLGVPLFDRSSRPISLTPAGSAFLSDARSILGRIDQAVNRIQEVSTGMVGTLRIGYTKGFERSNFSNSLRFFHNKYPNILVSCYRRNTDLLAAGLLKDEYDIIFTWDSTELVKNESIEYRLIERSPLMVAVYSNHPFSRRESLQRSELHGERLLFMTPSSTGDSVSDLRFYEMYEPHRSPCGCSGRSWQHGIIGGIIDDALKRMISAGIPQSLPVSTRWCSARPIPLRGR